MGKVWTSVYSTTKVEYSKEKENLLIDNEIPYTVSNNEIHFINEESSVHIASREYDKPYSLFLMRLTDSCGGSIGMGEYSLEKEKINALGEVFGEEFAVTVSLGTSYSDEEKWISLGKDSNNGGYELVSEFETYDFEDE